MQKIGREVTGVPQRTRRANDRPVSFSNVISLSRQEPLHPEVLQGAVRSRYRAPSRNHPQQAHDLVWTRGQPAGQSQCKNQQRSVSHQPQPSPVRTGK